MYSHRYKNKATPDLSIVERLGGSRVAKIRLCLEPAKLFFAKKIRLHGGTPARGRRYRRARAGVPRDTGGRTGKQHTGIQRITDRIRHRGLLHRANRLPSPNVNYLLKQDFRLVTRPSRLSCMKNTQTNHERTASHTGTTIIRLLRRPTRGKRTKRSEIVDRGFRGKPPHGTAHIFSLAGNGHEPDAANQRKFLSFWSIPRS